MPEGFEDPIRVLERRNPKKKVLGENHGDCSQSVVLTWEQGMGKFSAMWTSRSRLTHRCLTASARFGSWVSGVLAVSLVCRNETSGTLHVKGMLRGGGHLGLDWIGDGIEYAVARLRM